MSPLFWHARRRIAQYQLLLWAWLVVFFLGLAGGLSQVQWGRFIAQPVTVPAEGVPAEPRFQYTLPADFVPPPFTAQSIWVYERNSRSLLFEHEARTATSVASLAKLMTATVSFESYPLDESVGIGSASAAIGNRAKFLSRDVFSVYSLLHALLIFSANDAAEALAAHHVNGISGFVEAMNGKAQELGLTQTHFQNPSGLDHPLQYSTAADIGAIADHALSIPTLAEIVSLPTATVREVKTGRLDTVYTTNGLLGRNPAFRGVKTGTTEGAGESFVGRYVNEEFSPKPLDLIIVVLGSQNRFSEANAFAQAIETALQSSLSTEESLQ